jgi:serine/threonine-protein phosphatase PGAM5
MKRWLVVTMTLAALVASGASARAQGAGTPRDTSRTPAVAGSSGAARDTARAGYRYLYLIRHGWYDASDPRDARVGKALDSLGRAQARLTGQRLAGLPKTMNTLVSSTFTRAMETADLIGESLRMPTVRDSDISECSPPSYRPDYVRADNQAERDSCQAALERAWTRYVRPAGGRDDRYDVLVCHGNVIRWFVTKSLGLATTRWPDYDIGNCSISVIVVRPRGLQRHRPSPDRHADLDRPGRGLVAAATPAVAPDVPHRRSTPDRR